MSGVLGGNTYAVTQVREEQMPEALLCLSFDRRCDRLLTLSACGY